MQRKQLDMKPDNRRERIYRAVLHSRLNKLEKAEQILLDILHEEGFSFENIEN